MIAGQVDSILEPIVVLTISGESAGPLKVPFVVDTGYTGQILLPRNLIDGLRLHWLRDDRSMLADGSIIRHEVFSAWIVWDGEIREVAVDESIPPRSSALDSSADINSPRRCGLTATSP